MGRDGTRARPRWGPRPRTLALGFAVLSLGAPRLAHAAGAELDRAAIDQLWVLACSALIFLMQTGFLALEAGLVRTRNASVTALKNIVDWCVVSVLWLVFGYGLAFGDTAGGWVGTSLWLGEGLDAPAGNGMGWIYFLFQLGFAGTAVTIVSGAMAERVSFTTYVICSCVNGGLVYPLVSHWIWGGGFLPQQPWLAELGFRDFAGSTVVHTVGGCISLVSIWRLGPRIGRFAADGTPRPMEPHSMSLAALGVFILWFGWWGFNGGSTLSVGQSAALVIANTNLAGASAALAAWIHARWLPPRNDVEAKFMGGALAGLVAITAGANVVTPFGALAIGVLAGLVHNGVYMLLLRLRLDDPVGAVPVHLGGGVLGTVCVGLFGRQELLPRPRLEQIGVQALGSAVVIAFCAAVTLALLAVLRRTTGLRISPAQENAGLTLDEVTEPAPPPTPDEAELRRRMKGE